MNINHSSKEGEKFDNFLSVDSFTYHTPYKTFMNRLKELMVD